MDVKKLINILTYCKEVDFNKNPIGCKHCPYFKNNNCVKELIEDVIEKLEHLTEDYKSQSIGKLKKQLNKLTFDYNVTELALKNKCPNHIDYLETLSYAHNDYKKESLLRLYNKIKKY